MTGVGAAGALLLCAGFLQAQTRVTIVDAGPGASGPLLREALSRPHRLAEPDTAQLIITREVTVRGSLIVLGRTTRIEGSVEGDVIVVNADVFVRPGGRVNGRLVAIGGGAYPSALAMVTGEVTSFRENTFEIERRGDDYRLTWRSTAARPEMPLLFPVVYGLRMPTYDRINGLSVPFGPAISFGGDRGRVDPMVKWRTDLGVLDPSLRASWQFNRKTRATLDGGRGSFSNDDWIWPDFVNSLSVLTFGDDTRNFYRADRGSASLHRLWEGVFVRWEPYIGVTTERDWSVGSSAGARSGPWSLLGRKDTLSMWRANPAITPGHITSALVGTTMNWESEGLRIDGRTRIEVTLQAPGSRHFQQVTSDLAVTFPTFGEQSYAMDVHWVTSLGDSVPPQRYAYLGGSGTLPFLDMLSLGGDELFLIDERYSIPLTRVDLGDFGIPTLQLRHRVASAGIGRMPDFETMLGVGIAVIFVRGEVQVNPATGKARLAAGFTFAR